MTEQAKLPTTCYDARMDIRIDDFEDYELFRIDRAFKHVLDRDRSAEVMKVTSGVRNEIFRRFRPRVS